MLTVTGRWTTPDGKLSKALLKLHNLPNGHAGKLTAPCLFKAIKSLGIKKPGNITSDNATCNDIMMVELSKLLEIIEIDWDLVQYRIRCFGHQNILILEASGTMLLRKQLSKQSSGVRTTLLQLLSIRILVGQQISQFAHLSV